MHENQISSAEGEPGVLMLGLGWFPDSLGGLDRYFRALLEQMPRADGVVLGPAGDAPARVHVAALDTAPLLSRLLSFRRAALSIVDESELIDAHFALYALWPLLSRRLRSRPTVFHFHGPWADESEMAGDANRARGILRRAIERRALHHASEVIVLSGAFRRLLVERYRLAPWQIHAWPAGVALDRFTPDDRARARARLGLGETGFVAVCARRLVARMGIDDLLDAWDRLPADSTLLVIGDGPLRERLDARADESVRVLGRVSDDDLLDAYRAADVAVVPSRAFEGFGLVVLEAAACGTPSIVSDIGGLPEVAAGLDRSLIVAAGDVDALAARLSRAAAGELPSRSRTRAFAERHRWDALAERHRDLYRRVRAGERDGRPRVVYLDHVARLSGGEIALLRLLPHMSAVNAHVVLGEDGPLVARLVEAGISVEVLPIAPGARDVRKDSLAALGASPRASAEMAAYVARLAWRLRSLRPDLVHANSLKSGFYGGVAARAVGVPLVWHLRDRLAEDYLPRTTARVTRGAIRSLASGVLANSEATLETVARSGRHRLYTAIPDSVERSSLAPVGGGEAGLVFGMLGRISPWKGQDLFLRAFARAFPDGSQRAVVVGTPLFGEDDFERSLRELIDELGLRGRVEMRGFREDVWPELASFDVLVHASVAPEPFGQVVLEGMAAGLAVIAPNEGGPASVVDDGRTGLLFASRQERSLAGAMQRLSDDPALRARLGDAASLAVESYHPAVIADRFERAYEQLLAAAERSRPGL